MSHFLPQEMISRVRISRANGVSLRALACEFGISKNTVKRYINNNDSTKCACGDPSGHQGWCKNRYAKSAARQAFHTRRRGVFQTIEIPPRISRIKETTTEKRKWVGAIDANAAPLSFCEYYGAIGEVVAATKRINFKVREDVCQEMILACFSGRLPRTDIERAVTTFINFVYRGCCYNDIDPRFNKPAGYYQSKPGHGLFT